MHKNALPVSKVFSIWFVFYSLNPLSLREWADEQPYRSRGEGKAPINPTPQILISIPKHAHVHE